MKTEINNDSVYINGVEYIPKTNKQEVETSTEGLPYVIIRTYSAGVHMGYLKSKTSTSAGMEVELIKSRRLWQWAGALTLSDLAVIGTSKPKECKLTLEVPSIELVAIEIIKVTKEGFINLNSIPIWK